MIFLGIDPGFANLGWCHAEYDGKTLVVRDMGTVTTNKSTKKIPVAWDNIKRTQRLHTHLMALALVPHPSGMVPVDCTCAEAMSYPPNAATAAKMSLSWGVIASVTAALKIPLVQPSPRDIKMAVAGSHKASKAMMSQRLHEYYPEIEALLDPIPGSRREHPIDALGAIVASLQSDVVKAVLR